MLTKYIRTEETGDARHTHMNIYEKKKTEEIEGNNNHGSQLTFHMYARDYHFHVLKRFRPNAQWELGNTKYAFEPCESRFTGS